MWRRETRSRTSRYVPELVPRQLMPQERCTMNTLKRSDAFILTDEMNVGSSPR